MSAIHEFVLQMQQRPTPASTLVISNTLIPANGNFSFTCFVAMPLHCRCGCAASRPTTDRDLALHAATLDKAPKELILLFERCHL